MNGLASGDRVHLPSGGTANVGDVDVVVANIAQTCQYLRERRHNQVLGVTATK